MKCSTRATLFWALVAGQSLSTAAFSPGGVAANQRHRMAERITYRSPIHAATLEDLDREIPVDALVAESTSFPDFEEYTEVLQDSANYPPNCLPKNIVGAAFEVLHQWGKLETVEGAKIVDQLIERFEQEDAQILNTRHYTVAVEAWANSGHAKAAGRAEKALLRMEEVAKTNPFAEPNRIAYSIVVRAYADEGNASKASSILHRMEASPNLSPTNGDYGTVLAIFAREGDPRRSEEMLKRMVDLCKNGALDYAPGLNHYHMVLDSWARSGEAGAGERARQILEALHGLADQGELNLQPDERTYTGVMNAVVRSAKENDMADQAQELLELARARGIVPDVFLLTSTMQAYANQGKAEKTEEILEQMEEEGIANAAAYNTVVKAWKSSGALDAPERAERCLERMAAINLANTIGYTTVIAAYASRGDSESAEKAESLLQEMQKLRQEGNNDVKPNVQTINAVLNSWVQCGDVVRAETILNRMEQLSEAGDTDIHPSVVSYSTVINGWWKSKQKDGPARAERVFRRMDDAYKAGNQSARPNLVSYVNLINAIIRSGGDDSAQRAQDVLFEMHELYKGGKTDVKPNARAVAFVMDCWQKSGKREAGEKAEALLDWVLNLYNETGDKDFQPNEYICSLAISAWSKSRSFGKAAHARTILQKMKALHKAGTIAAPPNTHCYTAVINSCAYCMDEAAEKRQALEIALATYKELERTPSHGKPNHVTYATMVTALTNLLPPSTSRSAAVSSIFKRCRETGQVDGLVIKRLQGALTREEMSQLCPESLVKSEGRINAESIPTEWRQNLHL